MIKILRSIRDRLFDRMYAWITHAETREWQRKRQMLFSTLGAVGKNVRITPPFTIHCPSKVYIGNNVHIGEGVFIRGEGSLVIEDNAHISRHLTIYTANHQYEGARLPYDENLVHRPVRIGRNVWIGMNVNIAPGAEIGDGAIIALGAVVSGIVPSGAIVGSPKWRVLKQRNMEHYFHLERSGLYGGVSGLPMTEIGNDRIENDFEI